MVDGLLADIGICVVLPICSSPLATGLSALESDLWHLDSLSEEFLDKVSVMTQMSTVDLQERFPVSQTDSMYQMACFGRGSKKIEDLERLLVDWERQNFFHCNSIL